MAVQWTVEQTRGSVYLFDPADLIINPDLNGRQEAPDVKGLIADILERGQLQPVLVGNDGGKPVLRAGFSRWRAISEINKQKLTPKPMPIKAVFFRGDERQGFLANLAENLQRNATTPLDDAHNCRRLEAWGMSPADIAKKVKRSEAWVRGRLKISEATPELKKALADGRVNPSAATAIAAMSAEQQKSIVKGNGKVAAPANGRPGMKDLRSLIVDTYGDTTRPRVVRDFCRSVIAQHWPAELKAEEETAA